jgi:hypothetical protein
MTNQAWECPRCKRINAPFNPACFCIPSSGKKGFAKVLDDIKYINEFNRTIAAHCHVCGVMLNGLTKHVCKVSL